MTRGLKGILRRLDRSGGPAYAQIEERLEEAMDRGDLQPGDRLPPEREMAERLGVSRMTLRQALDSLSRKGLVNRTVGRRGGTFVARPKIERDLSVPAGLTAALRRQGHRAGARIIDAEEGPAATRTARALGLEPGARVIRVVRVRLSDDEPLALERSMFSAARFPGLLHEDLEGSLYELLAARYGTRVARAVEGLEPVVADPDVAELLEVPEGAPLMLVERTAFDLQDVPVEYARDVFRGDRTRVTVESHVPAPAPVGVTGSTP